MQPQITPQLRKTIDELIALDTEQRTKDADKYPNGLTIAQGKSDEMMARILNRKKSPVLILLESLSCEDLMYVTALMWWGRGDRVAEQGAIFDSVLDHARGMSAGYVAEKPLGKYLKRGLARLGIA